MNMNMNTLLSTRLERRWERRGSDSGVDGLDLKPTSDHAFAALQATAGTAEYPLPFSSSIQFRTRNLRRMCLRTNVAKATLTLSLSS